MDGEGHEERPPLFGLNLTLQHEEEEFEEAQFPLYLRVVATGVCLFLLVIGVTGNLLVPFVVLKTKDLRNSTNIFLINLSIADLLVLMVCTPTVLVELHSMPEVWFLGEFMCKAVSFLELLVAHASVLTIVAIGIERYYAICRPLQASSQCTKRKAMVSILCIWMLSLLSTVPLLMITELDSVEYLDGTLVPVCVNTLQDNWHPMYFVLIFVLFFCIPFIVLLLIFTVISKRLVIDSKITCNQLKRQVRIRKQVVIMLASVCGSFFLCLFPFRCLTLWILSASPEDLESLGMEKYYSILFSSRLLIYVNSSLNPILYNLISSKFRKAFRRMLRITSRQKGSEKNSNHTVVSERLSNTIHNVHKNGRASSPSMNVNTIVADMFQDMGSVTTGHSL